MDTLPKKIDRRVIKTKRAIRNAFAKLLTLKNIDEITIKDIADEADVNRKTIYNYYNGTYEILDEIENDLVLSFENVTKDINLKDKNATTLILERLNNILNEDIDFYGHLLDINVNSLIVRKIVTSLKSLLKNAFLEQDLFPISKVDVIVDYVGAGILGAYQSWFMNDTKQSINAFSKDVSLLVYNGIDAMKK